MHGILAGEHGDSGSNNDATFQPWEVGKLRFYFGGRKSWPFRRKRRRSYVIWRAV